MHTHIGIGVYVIDNRLRYVEASDDGLISTQLGNMGRGHDSLYEDAAYLVSLPPG